jgi:hypothetical protein
MSQSSQSTESVAGPRWGPIAGWTIVGLLGATLLVFVATVMFGAVHGVEFCPQTFERRSYSFYELPLLGVQVTGERLDDLTGPTETFVTSQSYFTAGGPKKDWHVLVGSQGTRLRRPGDAGILMKYLDAEESGDRRRWVHWSEEHPDLAKVFWPAVQQLAINDAYVFVPDLFDLTKTVDCDDELTQAVKKLLADKLPTPQAEAEVEAEKSGSK